MILLDTPYMRRSIFNEFYMYVPACYCFHHKPYNDFNLTHLTSLSSIALYTISLHDLLSAQICLSLIYMKISPEIKTGILSSGAEEINIP